MKKKKTDEKKIIYSMWGCDEKDTKQMLTSDRNLTKKI